jgi:DNA topoisomerase-1
VSDPSASIEAARAASLRYVSDTRPGITREKHGDGFRYRMPDGSVISDDDQLARIRKLAIPPAWTAVWICPQANGHIQAVGRDAKGRKQYRYHQRWREVRDETKYGRMLAFAAALPTMRAAVDRDLALPGLPRERVLATLVRLLETTYIRIGNDEYARTNKSFGLTTLRDKHVEVSSTRVRFKFRGKSGKDHDITLQDRRLATLVRRCRDVPGQDLFQYITDDGVPQPVTSSDVNEYLRAISGQDFTAKDFRTWGGTLLASTRLATAAAGDAPPGKAAMLEAIRAVADRLGNTVTVCRKCYIHPSVLAAFEEAALHQHWRGSARTRRKDLTAAEARLVAYLSRCTNPPE